MICRTFGWTWDYVETALLLDEHIPAIQRHLRQHPPEFALIQAYLGYKAPDPPAAEVKRKVPKTLPARRLKTSKRTPDNPFSSDDEAAIAALPLPGMLQGGKL